MLVTKKVSLSNHLLLILQLPPVRQSYQLKPLISSVLLGRPEQLDLSERLGLLEQLGLSERLVLLERLGLLEQLGLSE